MVKHVIRAHIGAAAELRPTTPPTPCACQVPSYTISDCKLGFLFHSDIRLLLLDGSVARWISRCADIVLPPHAVINGVDRGGHSREYIEVLIESLVD